MENTISVKKDKGVGGVPVRAVAIPSLILVLFMALSIFGIIIIANTSNDAMVDEMNRLNTYRLDAIDMLGASSQMSETCNTYVQSPQQEQPPYYSNFGLVGAYVEAFVSENTPEKTLQRFKSYQISNEALLSIAEAASNFQEMRTTQLHAFYVMNALYPLNNCPPPYQIKLQPLLDALDNLSAEEKAALAGKDEAYAESLINDTEYAQARSRVQSGVNECNVTMQTNFEQRIQEKAHFIKVLRNILAVEAFIVTWGLVVLFILFFVFVLRPLRSYSKDIASNRSITNPGKVTEIRQLVKSYNQLWNYRNKLEDILRTEAENDALTGLPNRYCMERDWLRYEDSNEPIAIFMFDLNYLKKINDTKGHNAGDQALHSTALCIKECFSSENVSSCYRIGGDEFIAVLTGIDEAGVKNRIDRFRLATIRDGISVAVGYSFSEITRSDTFKKMIEDADNKMYEDKKRIHDLTDAEEREKAKNKKEQKSTDNEGDN